MYNLLKSFGGISWERELLEDTVNLMELTEPRGEAREKEFEEKLAVCDILQTDIFTKIDEELLKKAPNLKAIFCTSSGIDYVDVDAATKRGILVANNPDFCALSVAEFTMGLIYGLLRHIPEGSAKARSGQWYARRGMCGTEIFGKTLGIIGFGKIGKEVARQALGIGMQVRAYSPSLCRAGSSLQQVKVMDLDSLLRTSDVVTIHVPLTEQTLNLIGAREMGLMKADAFLINVSRGGIVDEDALCGCLEAGELAGAALDVLAEEPANTNMRLMNYSGDNLIITPHVAWFTSEAVARQCSFFVEQVKDFAAGRCPAAVVNNVIKDEKEKGEENANTF